MQDKHCTPPLALPLALTVDAEDITLTTVTSAKVTEVTCSRRCFGNVVDSGFVMRRLVSV